MGGEEHMQYAVRAVACHGTCHHCVKECGQPKQAAAAAAGAGDRTYAAVCNQQRQLSL